VREPELHTSGQAAAMTDDVLEVPAEVVAAHEAGHAVAAIVFGATFAGIELRPHENPRARVVDIHVAGLTDLAKCRICFGERAGETVATGEANLAYSEEDLRQLEIVDFSVLAYADTQAVELIEKYRAAFYAIYDLIYARTALSEPTFIDPEEVVSAAALHGAEQGAETSPFE
jgi:hypothetical protein